MGTGAKFVFILIASSGAGHAAASSCTIGRKAFDRLEAGMSIETSVALLGCEGEKPASEDIGDVHVDTYSWSGEDGGYASAMFKNGALAYKRQRGLR